MSALNTLLKFINALIMLSIIIVLSLFFGLLGFLVGLILAVIVSGLHSSYEKSRIEKQRHEEMLKAIKEAKT